MVPSTDPNAKGRFALTDPDAEVSYDDDIWVGYRHFATKKVRTDIRLTATFTKATADTVDKVSAGPVGTK